MLNGANAGFLERLGVEKTGTSSGYKVGKLDNTRIDGSPDGTCDNIAIGSTDGVPSVGCFDGVVVLITGCKSG